MESLSYLAQVTSFSSLAKEAIAYSEKNDLVPLVSFYLEKDLMRKLVKKLEPKLNDIFQKYRHNRDMFIKEAIKVLGGTNEINYTHFIYYAIPISEKSVIKIVKNNWIPPKAVILSGTVRFVFMPHSDLKELENAIKTQNEDDIIVEFENGIVKNYTRTRNIFTDFRTVTKVVQSKIPVTVNLFTSIDSILPLTIISNNVYAERNRIEITLDKDKGNYSFKILEGKASKQEVLEGETLSAESKAELYYDYKTTEIDQKYIANGLVYKIAKI